MWWLISKLFNRRIKMVLGEGYSKGLTKGYEFGYLMGQVEMRNSLYYESKADREIDRIIEEKGF